MGEAKGMKLAVLDADGNPLVVWEDNRLAHEIIAARIAQHAETRRIGRWPLRRTTQTEPTMTDAVRRALHQLGLETARL